VTVSVTALDLAMAEAAAGRLRAALDACYLALESDESARAHAVLGHVLLLAGARGQAAKVSEKAIEIDSEYAPAYATLGCALDELGGMADRSVLVWGELAQLRPDEASPHVHLGEALYAGGLHDEAIESWNEALKADSGAYRAIYDLALSALRAEGVATALPGLRAAGELDPGQDAFFFELLRIPNERIGSESHDVPTLLSHALYALEDEGYLAAMDAVRAILDVDADDARALAVAGLIYLRQASTNEAMACALRALAIAPETPAAILVLGCCCSERSGMDETAANVFGSLVKSDPGRAMSSVLLGEALMGLGRTRDAVRLLRRAVALEPACVRGHYVLAAALLAEHRWAESEWHVRRAAFHDTRRDELFRRLLGDEAEGVLR
jgi:tetratricopeptide (TPR) repeat protein